MSGFLFHVRNNIYWSSQVLHCIASLRETTDARRQAGGGNFPDGYNNIQFSWNTQ